MIRRCGALVLAATLALTLTSCTGNRDAATQTSAPAPSTSAPELSDSERPAPEPAPADPTCETLIPETLVTQFTDMGWSYSESELFGVDAPLEGSIQCMWGDYSLASSDAVQVFAWAPIDADTASAMQDVLISQGWERLDEGDTVYITAGARSPVRDEDGFGMTYKFVDGSVSFADTKQALLLINWPKP